MKRLLIATLAFLSFQCNNAFATMTSVSGLSIKKLRAVGTYESDKYNNTLEVWFTIPISFSAGSKCSGNFRVYIDAKNKHLVSLAMLAFATGKSVSVTVDDALPVRDGFCEVSYIDIDS